jgi:two-component system response regulator YesN
LAACGVCLPTVQLIKVVFVLYVRKGEISMDDKSIAIAFSHLLLSGTIVHEANFEELQHRYKTYIHPRIVLVVSIDRYFEICFGKPFLWRKEIAEQLLQEINQVVSIPFLWIWVEEGVLALLIEWEQVSNDASIVFQTFNQIARRIQRKAGDNGISVSIGIGGYYDNPYLLHLSYKEARDAMIDRFFQGNQLIFHFNNTERKGGEWKSPVTAEERMELQALMRIADEDGVDAYLRELLAKLAEAYQQDVEIFKSEVTDLLMLLTRIALDTGGDAAEILSENAALIQDLYKTIRYDHFVRKVCTYCRHLTCQMEIDHYGNVSPLMKKVLRFIKDNMGRRLTLAEVAQYCSLSHYYFSHQFKQEVGLSFIDYVNHLRLKKAVFYLEQTDWTIQQIASRTGFDDANYFSRLFKRYEQMTPSQYRKARLS